LSVTPDGVRHARKFRYPSQLLMEAPPASRRGPNQPLTCPCDARVMFERIVPDPDLPILDEGFLGRLAGYVGEAVLAELAADGLIELADRLARLAERLADGDLEGVARLGHDLVGMAGHLGLTRLSAAAAAMNRAARDREPAATAAQIARVRRLGVEADWALRHYLAERGEGASLRSRKA